MTAPMKPPKIRAGKVTDEHLATLEEAANRYPQPWPMGVSSHVMAALIRELRDLRARVGDS